MSLRALHLFLELFTLASFLATGWWAGRRFGRDGLWLYGFLFALGGVRENFVILERVLYGYADLNLMLGRAPLVGAIIWGFAIVAGVAAAEAIRGQPFSADRVPRAGELAWVALFLISLAGFFEPFLKLVEMARWQPGTATVFEVPKIALVGYPTFALASLAVGGLLLGRFRTAGARCAALALAVPPLALGHAWGLQRLKDALGW
jgi:hypothetical protein